MKRLVLILFLFIAMLCSYSQNEPAAPARDASAPTLNTTAAEIYYFHQDHLGSSAWVTDTLGHAVQHLAYMPWGERYISQKTGNFSTIYTFSGKERDEETGYSYFGQRFYDSEHSIWLSVDPMRGKYPNMSPFVYCANNPIKLVDPNGEDIVLSFVKGANGESSSKLLSQIINNGLSGQFQVEYNLNKDGKYTLSLVATDGGGDLSKMSTESRAFYEELSLMINDHSVTAEIDVLYGDSNTTIGNYANNTIDIADINQFDEMGEGLCSKQGKLIHEMAEQFGKAEYNVPKGSSEKYNINHSGAIYAENRVNGSVRGKENYNWGTYSCTFSKNGKIETYFYNSRDSIIKVKKR